MFIRQLWKLCIYRHRLPLAYRCLSSEASPVKDEFSVVPEYPLIRDESKAGQKEREKEGWRSYIRSLPTVEEKLYNMCRDKKLIGYYLNPSARHYNELPLRQYCTRSHLVRGLPKIYETLNVDVIYEVLKPRFVEAVVSAHEIHHDHESPNPSVVEIAEAEKQLTHRILHNILQVAFAGLAKESNHLLTSQVDVDPRCEACWQCGGFNPLPCDKKHPSPVKSRDFYFICDSNPHIHIRTTHPLPPFANQDDDICRTNEIASFPYDPAVAGIYKDRRHPTLTPGWWPGAACGFGHVSFHTLHELILHRETMNVIDEDERVAGHGMTASFTWLMGIAANQGFGPWTELTYPLATQTVLTNGQTWSFFAYQLNTTCLFGDISNNPKHNLCWDSGRMHLYDSIDKGQIKGLNDEVFKLILKFMINSPETCPNMNLSPYLKNEERNEDYWNEVSRLLWNYYAQLDPVKRIIEAPQWEKIYLQTNNYLKINPNRKRR